MKRYGFETVDVFTDRRFGGNQLAVFVAADGLDDATMQALAREMNLSETSFVLPPADAANTARVRIFNRREEMAFAGHPCIGTAVVLARGSGDAGSMRLEVPAGLVKVDLLAGRDGQAAGARIQAPQPFSRGEAVPPAVVAACLGLGEADVLTGGCPPTVASAGNPYVLAELSAEALARCAPDLAAFRRALDERAHLAKRFSIYAYVRTGEGLRARMFAPLAGTWEDPATGSAAAPLAGLLLSLSDRDDVGFTIAQGAEMGRPSRLHAAAHRDGDLIRVSVAGGCVPMFEGWVELERK